MARTRGENPWREPVMCEASPRLTVTLESKARKEKQIDVRRVMVIKSFLELLDVAPWQTKWASKISCGLRIRSHKRNTG